MLWFKFILGLNFIFFCFKIIIIHYHTQKQKKIKFKPRMKLNHNMYINTEYFLNLHAGLKTVSSNFKVFELPCNDNKCYALFSRISDP